MSPASSNPYADAQRDSSNIPSYAVKGPVWDKPGSGPDIPGVISDVLGTGKSSSTEANKRLLGGTDPSEYKKYDIPDGAVKGPIYDTPGSDPVSQLLGVGQDTQKQSKEQGKRFDRQDSSIPSDVIVGPVYDKPGSDPVSQFVKGLTGQKQKRFDRQDSSIPSDVIVGPVYDKPGSDPVSQFLGVGKQPAKRCTTYKDIGSDYTYDVPSASDYTKRNSNDNQEPQSQPTTTPRTVVAPTNSHDIGILSVPHFTATVPSKPDYLTDFKRAVGQETSSADTSAAPQATQAEADAASQGAKYFPLNPNGDYSLVNPSNAFSPAHGLTNGLSDVGSHFGVHQGDQQQQQQQAQAKRQFGGGLGGAGGGLNPLGSFGGAGSFGGFGAGAQGAKSNTNTQTAAPGSSPSDALGSGGAADGYSNFLAPVIDGKTYGLGAAYAPSSSATASASATAAPTPRQAEPQTDAPDVTITSTIIKTVTQTIDPVTYRGGPTPSSASQSQTKVDPSAPTVPAVARRGLGFGFPTLEVPPVAASASGSNAQGEMSVALVFILALVATLLGSSVFAVLLLKVRASLRDANRIRLAVDEDDEVERRRDVVEVKRVL